MQPLQHLSSSSCRRVGAVALASSLALGSLHRLPSAFFLSSPWFFCSSLPILKLKNILNTSGLRILYGGEQQRGEQPCQRPLVNYPSSSTIRVRSPVSAHRPTGTARGQHIRVRSLVFTVRPTRGRSSSRKGRHKVDRSRNRRGYLAAQLIPFLSRLLLLLLDLYVRQLATSDRPS